MFSQEEKDEAYHIKFTRKPHPIQRLKGLIEQNYFAVMDENNVSIPKLSGLTNIPKHILLFWHDSVLPEDVQHAVDNIRSHNFGYEVSLYSSEMAYEFIQRYYGDEYAHIYDRRCLHPAMKSDFFRMCYLLQNGGFYVDVDIRCYAPLENIFTSYDFDCFFLYTKGTPYCVDNDFIACSSKNKVIERILGQIYQHLTCKYTCENVWEYTGPGAVSVSILYLLADKLLGDKEAELSLKGLILGERLLTLRSYGSDEFEYKKHPEGNWRYVVLPKNLYLR